MSDLRRFVISSIPPSVNQQKQVQKAFGNGRPQMAKSQDYRAWLTHTSLELQSQRGFPEGHDFIWRSDILFPCNVSNMDVDNAPKAIHDLLVKLGKVPDDRYLADCRIRWATGDKIIVAIKQEELSKWSAIKKLSPTLMKKLAKRLL